MTVHSFSTSCLILIRSVLWFLSFSSIYNGPFFFLYAFEVFPLFFGSLSTMCLGYVSVLYLTCLLFIDLPRSIIWYLPLILENALLLSFQIPSFSVLFTHFSFWYSNYTYVGSSDIVPKLLESKFFVFALLFFSLCALIWEISFNLSSSVLIIFSYINSTNEPSKAFFLPLLLFFTFSIFIWFFFIISTSLPKFFIYSCTLFVFSISTFNILMIVIWNLLSDSLNIWLWF